ncbi:hypothetical protein H6F88_00990 [Oculatella sp. FACHB-28]|uniref:hypothetical protein n=1 Tax=Oculatella sp. FACHB-28 TaxID=2692845 RepID=UPI001682FAED|nr:hypothetical protein [Oculatella sp. FACHB-28]MBD2054618.1 hypothetical protein [Oculatella sp. FACHB-28]
MALFDDLAEIGVPLLGAVIGGPPGLAAGVIGLITNALGIESNSTMKEIARNIQTNPEAVIKLRELEDNYQQYLISVRLQMDQAEYADRANARSREVEITKATGKRDWYPPFLSTFVVFAFTLLLCTMVFYQPEEERDDNTNSLINILIGTLTAGFSTVLGYYFGSSSGSRTKDETISQLSSDVTESISTPPQEVNLLQLPSPSPSPRSSWRDL